MTAVTTTTSTCEAFAESLCNVYFFDAEIDDMFWRDSFKAENLFEMTKNEAEKRGVVLSDSETWDFETYFWEVYESAEKGLS